MNKKFFGLLLLGALFLTVAIVPSTEARKRNACNPCGMKNACNPCGMKHKKKRMKNACNPCGMKNACNPCASGPKSIRKRKAGNYRRLVRMGKRLWNDDNLSTTGVSCMSCHEDYDLLNLGKRKTKTWPHYVKMPNDIVSLDQMVNFCMINPMGAKQINPNSVKMTAMTAYYTEYIKKYKPKKRFKKRKMKNACNPCGR